MTSTPFTFPRYFAGNDGKPCKPKGILIDMSEEKSTEYIKTEFCERANTEFFLPLPEFNDNEIVCTGYPGIFDVITENTDECRENPIVMYGIQCVGTKKSFVLMTARSYELIPYAQL